MQKLGLSMDSLTTGKLKDAGSPFKQLSDEQRAYLEGLINDLNAQFSGDVAKERQLAPEAIALIADGRAMTGARAQAIGLVDELGGQEEAVGYLKKELGLKGDVPLLKGPKKKNSFFEKLTSSLPLVDPRGAAALTALADALEGRQSLPELR